MMLRGFNGCICRAKPELLIGIEAEVAGDFENLTEMQFAGQTLAVPSGNGLVPPHSPFPTRQPIHRLEIHDGSKTFNVIHGSVLDVGAVLVGDFI
jgi:hypothetical protein